MHVLLLRRVGGGGCTAPPPERPCAPSIDPHCFAFSRRRRDGVENGLPLLIGGIDVCVCVLLVLLLEVGVLHDERTWAEAHALSVHSLCSLALCTRIVSYSRHVLVPM